MVTRFIFAFALGASVALAQDQDSEVEEVEEVGVEETSGTDSPAAANQDEPFSADLPQAPSDADALSADDIIPMAPMPELALPDEALVDPNALFMDELPPEPPPAVAIESAAQKQRDSLIRYREVRVQAEKDPQVVQMGERAEKEKTLEGKRAALREYYRLLFARVAAIDESLEQTAQTMELAYIRRLAQVRLEPTIPLAPPPTPEPLD